MKKTAANLRLLTMLFGVGFILSNIIGGKAIATSVWLFGGQVTLPGGIFCYAVTFLVMDVIGELWGKIEQRQTMVFGMICQLVALTLILITKQLPTVDPDMKGAYDTLLGINIWFVTGSLAAFALSQWLNINLFHKIRGKILKEGKSSKARGIWNNGSTMIAQLVDTTVFVMIAFGVGLGWLASDAMRPTLFVMIATKYLFNFVLAAVDTPFFYLLTRDKATP